MNDDVRVKVALVCGALSAIYLFIRLVVVRKNTRTTRLKEKAERDGTIVTATAIKKFYRENDDETRTVGTHVIYEYVVDGKKYRRKLYFADDDYPLDITIYYDKSNPRKAIDGGDVSTEGQVANGCATTLIVPIIITILVRNLLRLI